MGTIWLVSLSVFGVSILGAIWIKKHLSPIQKLLLLIAIVAVYKYNFDVTSPNYPDWVNIVLSVIFWIPYGSAFLYFFMEFIGFINDMMDEASKNSNGNKNNYEESMDIYERAKREEQIKNLRDKKYDLEFEQKSIITSNTVFGIPTGNNLSPSELEHNRRRYNRLSKEIEEIEDTLKKLNDK